MAQVLSVNVGMPREVVSRGQVVRTGIFKSPAGGRVAVELLNLAGDAQADLTVHGGTDKAVYAYPAEHYSQWRQELPELDLAFGAFGENLTTSGFHESTIKIGDRLHIGTAVFRVTQPRMPCFKLGVRFDRPDIIKHFLHSGRSGFYLAVVQAGDVGAGDAIEHRPTPGPSLSVAAVTRLYVDSEPDPDLLLRASELADLPERWREHFRKKVSGRVP